MAEVTLTIEEYETLMDLARGKAMVDSMPTSTPSEIKKKRKASASSKRYGKAFKKLAPSFKLKNGSWKKNGFRNTVRAAHKMVKSSKKI